MINCKEYECPALILSSCFLKDALRCLLHTLAFLRSISSTSSSAAPSNSLSAPALSFCERRCQLGISFCQISNADVAAYIEGKIQSVTASLESKLSTEKRVNCRVVISFYDLKRHSSSKSSFWGFLGANDEKVYFESWSIPLSISSTASLSPSCWDGNPVDTIISAPLSASSISVSSAPSSSNPLPRVSSAAVPSAPFSRATVPRHKLDGKKSSGPLRCCDTDLGGRRRRRRQRHNEGFKDVDRCFFGAYPSNLVDHPHRHQQPRTSGDTDLASRKKNLPLFGESTPIHGNDNKISFVGDAFLVDDAEESHSDSFYPFSLDACGSLDVAKQQPYRWQAHSTSPTFPRLTDDDSQILHSQSLVSCEQANLLQTRAFRSGSADAVGGGDGLLVCWDGIHSQFGGIRGRRPDEISSPGLESYPSRGTLDSLDASGSNIDGDMTGASRRVVPPEILENSHNCHDRHDGRRRGDDSDECSIGGSILRMSSLPVSWSEGDKSGHQAFPPFHSFDEPIYASVVIGNADDGKNYYADASDADELEKEKHKCSKRMEIAGSCSVDKRGGVISGDCWRVVSSNGECDFDAYLGRKKSAVQESMSPSSPSVSILTSPVTPSASSLSSPSPSPSSPSSFESRMGHYHYGLEGGYRKNRIHSRPRDRRQSMSDAKIQALPLFQSPFDAPNGRRSYCMSEETSVSIAPHPSQPFSSTIQYPFSLPLSAHSYHCASLAPSSFLPHCVKEKLDGGQVIGDHFVFRRAQLPPVGPLLSIVDEGLDKNSSCSTLLTSTQESHDTSSQCDDGRAETNAFNPEREDSPDSTCITAQTDGDDNDERVVQKSDSVGANVKLGEGCGPRYFDSYHRAGGGGRASGLWADQEVGDDSDAFKVMQNIFASSVEVDREEENRPARNVEEEEATREDESVWGDAISDDASDGDGSFDKNDCEMTPDDKCFGKDGEESRRRREESRRRGEESRQREEGLCRQGEESRRCETDVASLSIVLSPPLSSNSTLSYHPSSPGSHESAPYYSATRSDCEILSEKDDGIAKTPLVDDGRRECEACDENSVGSAHVEGARVSKAVCENGEELISIGSSTNARLATREEGEELVSPKSSSNIVLAKSPEPSYSVSTASSIVILSSDRNAANADGGVPSVQKALTESGRAWSGSSPCGIVGGGKSTNDPIDISGSGLLQTAASAASPPTATCTTQRRQDIGGVNYGERLCTGVKGEGGEDLPLFSLSCLQLTPKRVASPPPLPSTAAHCHFGAVASSDCSEGGVFASTSAMTSAVTSVMTSKMSSGQKPLASAPSQSSSCGSASSKSLQQHGAKNLPATSSSARRMRELRKLRRKAASQTRQALFFMIEKVNDEKQHYHLPPPPQTSCVYRFEVTLETSSYDSLLSGTTRSVGVNGTSGVVGARGGTSVGGSGWRLPSGWRSVGIRNIPYLT